MSLLDLVRTTLRERFPEAVLDSRVELGDDVVIVARDELVGILRLLRDHDDFAFEMLADLSSVDWLPREPRWDVNYHLYSLRHNHRLRVKVQLEQDDPVVASCVEIWPGADWQEREVYDLMGITFTGHPDLRRILMPDEWEGHPHRKDYPIGGVPVEYKIEPAYVGHEQVSGEGRASMGGIPIRTRRDRGKPSPWTWTGLPASEIRRPEPEAEQAPVADEEEARE